MPLPGSQRHKELFEKKEVKQEPQFLQEVKLPVHQELVEEPTSEEVQEEQVEIEPKTKRGYFYKK